MQLIDVKFDNGQGDAKIVESKGVIEIDVADSNPAFPSGAKITIPLDQFFEKLEASAPNVFVKWAEEAAQSAVDSSG